MTAAAVAAALKDARFDARQDSRHEPLAGDERVRAKLTEWERINQLLAATALDTAYDPDTGPRAQGALEPMNGTE
ncbi:hypothetical protein [Streptomyces sp. V4I2]|uniref:hypothetical protein n=1 Tax=Streptomyces sp. V4I2 TaxID=3042280 RepID=UPI00277D2813|nr:hypothetical protein [Streptomyces sp. V4I2]MDQ1051308.1 hypothetical protein [Streptomyces sp. V4I2]